MSPKLNCFFVYLDYVLARPRETLVDMQELAELLPPDWNTTAHSPEQWFIQTCTKQGYKATYHHLPDPRFVVRRK